MEVTGIDLYEAEQKLTAQVCEGGPVLELKLRAFCDHQQPKDAFDIPYTLRHDDGGTSAAATASAEDVRVGNPACPDAFRSLRSTSFTNLRRGRSRRVISHLDRLLRMNLKMCDSVASRSAR